MRVSKKLFFFLMIGICMISLNINAVSADDQYCFKLIPTVAGDWPVFLKLGVMDYGNHHIALSGTTSAYNFFTDHYSNLGLVHGNAEIVNGNVEVSLTATGMSSDGTSSAFFLYHLRLDMTTLNGVYTIIFPTGTSEKRGPVSVVSCSGL